MRNPLITALLALALTGCGAQQPADQSTTPVSSPQEEERRQQVILTWLNCDECTEGELEALRALGPAAVESLASTLENGPPMNLLDRTRDHLRTTYREMQADAGDPNSAPGVTEEEYIALYLANYVTLHRTRAARGLGAIGSGDAQAALRRSLEQSLPAPVERAVKEALSAPSNPPAK